MTSAKETYIVCASRRQRAESLANAGHFAEAQREITLAYNFISSLIQEAKEIINADSENNIYSVWAYLDKTQSEIEAKWETELRK